MCALRCTWRATAVRENCSVAPSTCQQLAGDIKPSSPRQEQNTNKACTGINFQAFLDGSISLLSQNKSMSAEQCWARWFGHRIQSSACRQCSHSSPWLQPHCINTQLGTRAPSPSCLLLEKRFWRWKMLSGHPTGWEPHLSYAGPGSSPPQ